MASSPYYAVVHAAMLNLFTNHASIYPVARQRSAINSVREGPVCLNFIFHVAPLVCGIMDGGPCFYLLTNILMCMFRQLIACDSYVVRDFLVL